jgi:hypothetical protein
VQKHPPIASITVSFSIEGRDFDPDLLSEIAGCSPTEIWHPNPRFLAVNPRLFEDCPDWPKLGWIFELVRHPCWSIDDAIGEDLEPFRERREQIVYFAKQHGCSIHIRCQLFGDETVIVYMIETGTIDDLAAFNCSISCTIDPDAATAAVDEKQEGED